MTKKKKVLKPGHHKAQMKKVKSTKGGIQITLEVEGVEYTYNNKVKKDGKAKD